MRQPSAEIESDLLDLTDVSLQELRSYDGCALAPVVEHLLRDISEFSVSTAGGDGD